ncbi:efflux RND transporter periplasmic adaptor subunit [Pseudaestuariivita rosea]|uniref:efflux RND transporter periplasmic adaptor subunit n=1 Tax=Pseudaestuariivita rosea TaxID=2763263 RepID=UPI001ABAA6C5|nr:efflux RND transporter periplasmic adaptor subunit [Pseudaestuariivita rosea]
MRLFPILTALLVSGFLYLMVFERDALMAFAAGAAETMDTAADTESAGIKPVSVMALRSNAQSIDNAVILRGQTEAWREVVVRAETSGLVVSDPLRKGSRVNAGDLLCQIDPGTREAQLTEAEARLQEARINDNAASQLSEGGFASQTRVASTTAAVQAAEAGVKAARTEIDRLAIHAPFAGLLESDTAEIGSLLQPGDQCATVIQLDPIKLVGFVPEVDVDRITVGARAAARLTSGRDVTGDVVFVARSADELTRTFEVEIAVQNNDLAIRDGQTVEILIASDGLNAHLLPGSALTLDDNGTLGVRVIDDQSKASFAPVTFIRDSIEGVWVDGLPQTVEVIVVGQEYVTDGVPVTPTYRGGN